MAERINYPAPLLEGLEIPLLTKMLVPTHYQVPEKKAKKKAKGTRGGLCRKGTSDATSEDAKAHSSVTKDDEEKEEEEDDYSEIL